MVERCSMRGGRERDIVACVGTQGEKGFVSGKNYVETHSFMPFCYFYYCFHRNDIFILSSSQWLVSSRPSVTTPGDEKKKKGKSIQGV